MRDQLKKKLLSAQAELLATKAAQLPAGPNKTRLEAQAVIASLRLSEISGAHQISQRHHLAASGVSGSGSTV